jgi:hypothetical protein
MSTFTEAVDEITNDFREIAIKQQREALKLRLQASLMYEALKTIAGRGAKHEIESYSYLKGYAKGVLDFIERNLKDEQSS